MIIGISKPSFDNIVKNDSLDLPIRWDGRYFYSTLKKHFEKYKEILAPHIAVSDLKKVKSICDVILTCVDLYHDGFPAKAYNEFYLLIHKLMNNPLMVYRKSWIDPFMGHDPLMLFRIRNVCDSITYKREDVFHTPFNLRSKVSTCRYSIPGFPCLYLGTSLKLCCEETKPNNFTDLTIASRFVIERCMIHNDIDIKVIELAIKPKDFLERNNVNTNYTYLENPYARRFFNQINLNDINVMSNYLFWYPLISACSYIRVNKKDPFASEYIIPQLLMQWVRSQINEHNLIGIRYFSCTSRKASDFGFNYVFPVSGKKYRNKSYCNMLGNAFRLTEPCFIQEFESVKECEHYLRNIPSGGIEFQKIKVI